MNENRSVLVDFFKTALTTFASAIIAISIVGWLVGDVTKEVGGLLSLGREGISYVSIMQVFIFSLVQAGIKVLLLSNIFFKKMMLLWKTVLMFLLSFAAGVLFSVLFRWFPIESLEAWIGFLVSISACFIIGILVVIAKTKLEDRKYKMLLSNYKARQNQEKGDEL